MNSSFPTGYSPPAIDLKFDEKFLKHLKKDTFQLQTFFQVAIKDMAFWNSQSLEMKQKITKLVEENIFQKDDEGKKSIIQIINKLSREEFVQVFQYLNNSNVLGFFKGELNLNLLREEDLKEIVDFSSFLKFESRALNVKRSETLYSRVLLKYIDLKTVITQLNKIKKENIEQVHLPYLVDIANSLGAESLKKNCLQTFNEKIGTKEVEITDNRMVVTVDDFEKIDLDALEICITFLKTNNEIEIKLLVDKYQSIEVFLDRFKNYICEICFQISLTQLPIEIGKLKNLKSLKVSRSIYLERLPDEITNLENLKELSLSGSSLLNSLPDGITNLKNLEVLNLSSSIALKSLPEELGRLLNLKQLDLRNCFELKSLPKSLGDLGDLQTLNLQGCNQLQSVCSFVKFVKLNQLALPYSLDELSRLKIFLDLEKNHPKVDSFVKIIFNDRKGVQSEIKINDLNILKKLLKGYFKSTNKGMIEKCSILRPQVEDYLLKEDGKKILIEFREEIFMNKYSIMNFILQKYSPKIIENWDLYPIKSQLQTENQYTNSINIKCIQDQVLSKDYLEKFLNIISIAIAELEKNRQAFYDLYIQYYGQPGIDHGGLRRDFVLNLFKSLSDFWGLNNGIPEKEEEKFCLLGPILNLIILNRHKNGYQIGNVFSLDYFKGMMAFQENQILSDFTEMSLEEILHLSLAFRTEKKRKLVEDILNFLSWDGSAKEINGKIEILLSLSDLEEELSLEVFNVLEADSRDSKNSEDSQVEDVENPSLNSVLDKRKVLSNANSPKCKIRKIEVDPKRKIEALKNYILKNKNVEIFKTIIKNTLVEDIKNQVHNLHRILHSCNFYKGEWHSLTKHGIERFMESIQGVPFTREKFLSSLEYQNISDEIRKDFEDWIKEADEVKVKSFLSLITGSYYLLINTKIKIEGNSENFEVSSCFFSVKIPNNINRDLLWGLLNAEGENSFNKH